MLLIKKIAGSKWTLRDLEDFNLRFDLKDYVGWYFAKFDFNGAGLLTL